MPKKQTKLSPAKYGKHRGVSREMVMEWKRDGIIPKTAFSHPKKRPAWWLVDVAKADKALDKNLDPAQLKKQTIKPDKTIKEKTDIIKKSGVKKLDFNAARTLNETYKAALRKLEYEEKSGETVKAKDVEKAAFDMARTLRDNILNVADRIAPLVTAETDQHKNNIIITDELRQALEDLI